MPNAISSTPYSNPIEVDLVITGPVGLDRRN